VKPGDLIRHAGRMYRHGHTNDFGIVLYDNDEGGTLKILDQKSGKMMWVVRSECEVLSERR
jgi:hypothetical protein